ncbi:MAG: PAS domain S-box protein [Candidatus Thermoplasmatota archaeon]
MHKLLERQLRRHVGGAEDLPAPLKALIEDIDRTYTESDADRRFVEHSLDLTSQELMQRNADLRSKQREQQVIFDSVPALIIYKDTRNRILRLNDSAAKVLGGTPAQLEGKATEDVLPKDVADALYEDDLRVISTGKPRLGIEESHPTADGAVYWMRTDKVPYLDEQGRVIGVIVFSVDITDRKAAEEQLKASEERHRLIVETATEGIWTLDLQGNTTFANGVMAQMLGHTREELAGRSVFDFISPEDLAAGKETLAALMVGSHISLDFRFRRKDGTDLWTQASGAPMLDAHGQIVGALGMLTDITKRRDAEDELRQAYGQLQKVDRDRMQFLNNAAHELGTPLTPIRLQIHLLRSRLRDGGRDLAEIKAVDILDRNFERLGHLVRDLLDSARLQAASMKLHRAPVDLRDVIYSSVETYLAPAAEAGVELRVPELPRLPVDCDTSRISQVLDNLLSNAVKFTPRGKAIDVEAEVRGGMARVKVRDNGAGMKPADLPRLFRPFSQVHDTMQATRGGTGLGLYISQGLVQAHGGSIHAESEGLGHGSTFWFEIPLRESTVVVGEEAVAA